MIRKLCNDPYFNVFKSREGFVAYLNTLSNHLKLQLFHLSLKFQQLRLHHGIVAYLSLKGSSVLVLQSSHEVPQHGNCLFT